MTTFLSKRGYKTYLASSFWNGGGKREMKMDVEWALLQDLLQSHMEEEAEAGGAWATSMNTWARPHTKITAVRCRQHDAHCWEGHSAPIRHRQPSSFNTLRTGGKPLGRVTALQIKKVWGSQQSSGLVKGLSQMSVRIASLGKFCGLPTQQPRPLLHC